MFWRLLFHGTMLVGSQIMLCVRNGGEKIEVGERLKLRRGRGAAAHEGCNTSTLSGSEVNERWAWASWWDRLSLRVEHVEVLHNTKSILLFQVVFHLRHYKELRLGRGVFALTIISNLYSVMVYNY